MARAWLVGVALPVAGTCFSATEYNPERYDVILNRSPFGSEPLQGAVSGGSAQEKAAAAALEKRFRLSFLLEGEGGEIRAGFECLQPKKGEPKSSILSVGESFMGMKLKGVDFLNSEATLLSNGKPVTFRLASAPEVKTPAKPATPQRRFGGGFRRPSPPQPPKTPAEPQLSPEEQRQRRAAIRANLQNYQMEVIRSGMPPLPIPLTQEMDDQLVSEGVLPPSK